jgi:hypothetical protein
VFTSTYTTPSTTAGALAIPEPLLGVAAQSGEQDPPAAAQAIVSQAYSLPSSDPM